MRSKQKNPSNTLSYLKGEQSILHLHQEGSTCPLGKRLFNDCITHLCWNFIVRAEKCSEDGRRGQNLKCYSQIRSLCFLEPACQEKPRSKACGSVFSTNLLLQAVTFVPEMLDEPLPSLILIQALCLGRTMQEQRVHSGKLLCWQLLNASRQTRLVGNLKVFSTQKWSWHSCWKMWVEVTAFLSTTKAHLLVIAFSTGRKVWVGRGSAVDQSLSRCFFSVDQLPRKCFFLW